jgi:hypothetical protein
MQANEHLLDRHDADCLPSRAAAQTCEERETMTKKVYLGDAVYVEYDGYGLVLTTEDGIRATNTIYLEPEVCQAFSQFIHSLRAPDEHDAKHEPGLWPHVDPMEGA